MLKQKLFNKLSFVFLKIRYLSKTDPFREFQRIIKPTIVSDEQINNPGIILITPVRVSPISNLFEGLIAKFYEYKGYDVRILLCNQSVRYCENVTKYGNKSIACSLCKAEQKRLIKLFKLKVLNANQWVTTEEINEIQILINSRSFANKKDYIFDDIDLYESITSGVMRFTLKSDIVDTKWLLKKFAFTAFFFTRVINNLKKSFDIKVLITSHGIYSTWGSIIEACKKDNIHSVVWGRGYIGQGKLLFGINQNYDKEFISEDSKCFEKIELTTEKIELVKSYYTKKMDPNSNVDYINYYKNINAMDGSIEELISLKTKYKTTFGMFTNIPWDGEMLKTTNSFPTTRFFLRTVIEWFSINPNCFLIIRTHPAEVSREEGVGAEKFEDLLKEEYPTLPDNIFLIKPNNSITSYKVSEVVDAVILFGSTMSLELALQRKLVIQTGRNHISSKNIVFEAHSKEMFYDYLSKVKRGELKISDEMFDNALKYAYYWTFKRHITDTSVSLNNLQFQSYHFNNKIDFLNDRMLSFVVSKISKKEKIIND